jgi:hypothetical protein
LIVILLKYQPTIQALLPSTKIRVNLGGITLETSLDALKKSIEESLWDESLTDEQWSWLERLTKGQSPYDKSNYAVLMPVRNAGLIRAVPRGFLTTATAVEITSLGRLLIKARREE